jgi:hypothetical protein
MLGFLKPRGELVEISGRTVVFLSAKAYKPDQKFEVKLGLPEPPGQTLSVAIRVLSCRPGPADFFVVVGIAEGRRVPPSLKGYPVRNYPRGPHRITVKSEGLPGYRAVTSNLGRGGFGAELDGELPEDKILNVHLEFDEPLGWTLDLKARVAWTFWKSQNRYETGFAFIEDPAYALALEQLAAWCDHMSKHEMVPFKPPDRLPPRRPNELPNQLPQAHQMPTAPPASPPMPFAQESGTPAMADNFPLSEAHRAVTSHTGIDDDPTPLGLPTLVQPPRRPSSISLKLPEPGQTAPLQRPSSFKLQSTGDADETIKTSRPAAASASQEAAAGPTPSEEDVGVRLYFEANLRGWAWEGADDAVVVVLEDIHGTDHWLEFPGCRGIQGRCRQREIALVGMAVARSSSMIDELTREAADNDADLMHFRFYDDHQRVVLDIVATDCREQLR